MSRKKSGLGTIALAVQDIGPCHCDHCPNRDRCNDERLACEWFEKWVADGEYRPVTEEITTPSRKTYQRVYYSGTESAWEDKATLVMLEHQSIERREREERRIEERNKEAVEHMHSMFESWRERGRQLGLSAGTMPDQPLPEPPPRKPKVTRKTAKPKKAGKCGTKRRTPPPQKPEGVAA